MRDGLHWRLLLLLVMVMVGAGLDKVPLSNPEPVWKDLAVAVGVGALLAYSLWRLGDPAPVALTFGVLYFLFSQRLDDINPLPKAPAAEQQDIPFVALFLLLYLCLELARFSERIGGR